MRQGASALRDAGTKGGATGSQISQLANQQDGLAKAMTQVAQKLGSSVAGNNAEAREALRSARAGARPEDEAR